jgi:hypothetical protein
MTYRRITVTMTTTGSVTPGFEELRKDYVYGGKQPHVPDASGRHRTPTAAAARAEEREERYRRFCELRKGVDGKEGMGKIAAGAEVGIARRAAARYEKQRLEELERRAARND